MNLQRVNKLIEQLESEGDYQLASFYKSKRAKLIKEINKKVSDILNQN